MKKMKKMRNTIYALLGIGMLTACSSDDLPLTQSDESRIITFSASMDKLITRAESHTHRNWDVNIDPNTMSVFGYADNEKMFECQQVTYTDAKWTYTPPQYWAAYADKNLHQFAACMPHNASATFADQVLKVPGVTLENGYFTDAPADTKQMPLVTHSVVTPKIGSSVDFVMDQTLTGFNFQFMLDPKMNQLRFFRIKRVELSDVFPTKGDITCTYSDVEKEVAWSIKETKNVTKSEPIVIGATVDDGNGGQKNQTIDVTSADFVRWEGNFYVIPWKDFNPTITVTYDVIDVYNDGTETITITRKDVKSDIVFNSTNFSEYVGSALKAGNRYPIKIMIMPKYLYVLADVDQTLGYLLIE